MFWGDAMGDAIPPMFAARAMPRIRARENLESEGRFRRRGYDETVRWWSINGVRRVAHLNYGETEDRRCDVTDPHAEDHGHEHIDDQDSTRSGACFTEDEGGHHLCDVEL